MRIEKPWRTILQTVAILGIGYVFLRVLGPVLLPFGLGLIPAVAAARATDRLQSHIRAPRWLTACLCTGIIYIVCFLVLFLTGRILYQELEGFFRSLPTLAGTLTEPVHRLEQSLLRLASRFPDGIGAALEQWTREFFRSGAGLGEKLYSKVFSFAYSTLRKMPDLAMFLATTLLSGFMLAAELPQLRALAERKLPKKWQDIWKMLLEKLKGTVFCYLKAQGKLMFVTFLVLTAGFLVLAIEYPLLLSLCVTLVDALPVLGSGLILIPWSLLQFLAGDTFRGVGLLCVYGASALLRTALEPRLLGKQMGLDPLLTLFSLYAGYRFFGIWGMILLPMAAMFLKQILH